MIYIYEIFHIYIYIYIYTYNKVSKFFVEINIQFEACIGQFGAVSIFMHQFEPA